jgi:hypothetical protein
MAKSTGRWVVYEKRGVEYVHVSKRFETIRKRRRNGNGFTRIQR